MSTQAATTSGSGARPHSGSHECSKLAFWQGRTHIGGHRGGGAEIAAQSTQGRRRIHTLENTPLSFQVACQAYPLISFVEFDVQLTGDGVPIVHHDWSVKVDAQACGGGGGGSVSLRVPVGHLSAAQVTALSQQPMARSFTPELSHCSLLCANEDPFFAAMGTPPTSTAAGSRQAREDAQRGAQRTLDALGIDTTLSCNQAPPLPLSAHLGLKDSFIGIPTLSMVLRAIPPTMGLNLELKYPSLTDIALCGLKVQGREEWFQRVWEVVVASLPPGGERQGMVFFSSFDPKLCILARERLQGQYPVLFLTMGGLERDEDERKNSLPAAIAFAEQAGLLGVVTHTLPLEGEGELSAWVGKCSEKGLVLGTFGAKNNAREFVLAQRKAGVHLVIVDDTQMVARGLEKMS
jgi:glycerophosphoryl diester phosphodiesterase